MDSSVLRKFLLPAIILFLLAAIVIWQKRPVAGVKIGVILAKTGSAGYIGEPEEQVLRALMVQEPYQDAIPGIGPVTLEYCDSAGKPGQATAFFEQFQKDPQVVAVIGPSTSGEAIELAKKALEYQLPLLTLAASKKIVQHPDDPNRINPWVFKFAQNDDIAVQKLLSVIANPERPTRIAFLHSDDGFGKSGVEVFSAADQASPDIEVTYKQSFPHELISPDSVVAGLPDTNIDAVVIWGTSPGPALIVGSLRRTRPRLPVYLSHGNASPAFLSSVGNDGEGVIVVGSRVLLSNLSPQTERDKVIGGFQSFWTKRFHTPPSHFAGHSRDALEALLRILRSNEKPSRDVVRKALENLGDFHGVTGTFRFTDTDHAGLDLSAFEVFVIKDGAFTPYSPKK